MHRFAEKTEQTKNAIIGWVIVRSGIAEKEVANKLAIVGAKTPIHGPEPYSVIIKNFQE